MELAAVGVGGRWGGVVLRLQAVVGTALPQVHDGQQHQHRHEQQGGDGVDLRADPLLGHAVDGHGQRGGAGTCLLYTSTRNPIPVNPYLWAAVKHILENRPYTGCAVNFKSTTVSFKVHKKIYNPVEEQQIIPNMQEPIISEELFDRVQETRQNPQQFKFSA